jgi:glycosyltransferase involved in cell wall biosynthesis
MFIPYRIPLISSFFNKFLYRLPLLNALSLNQFVFARPFPANQTKEEMDRKYSVSVVIPARNECGNIEEAIKRVPEMGSFTEIIFVEGNSTDNTWETIQEMYEKYKDKRPLQIMQQEGKGKGDAVRKGYSAAKGDILMILDADLTVAPEDLPKFYNAITSGKGEFINGVRLVYPMEKNAMRPLNTLGNYFFSSMFSWMLEMPVKDSLCGTKVMFRTDYVKLAENRRFFGDFDPFGDFDLLFGAFKLNLKIIDLPIRYRERKYGDTNISRFRHGVILLRMVMFAAGKIKFR